MVDFHDRLNICDVGGKEAGNTSNLKFILNTELEEKLKIADYVKTRFLFVRVCGCLSVCA